jgi:predicted RNase H-like nuclease
MVIDIPTFLADKGSREADREAGKFLGKRHDVVFPPPIRPVSDCSNRDDACGRRFQIEEKRISVFGWAIVSKVRSVDRILGAQEDTRAVSARGHLR